MANFHLVARQIAAMHRQCKIRVQEDKKAQRFMLVNQTEARLLRGLTNPQRQILELINDSKTKGIWSREIENRTRIPKGQVKSILLQLEKARLIKKFKDFDNKSRTMYIKFGLIADNAMTGPWFDEKSEWDVQLISTVKRRLFQVIRKELTGMSLEQLAICVNQWKKGEKRVFSVEFTQNHILKILNVMVLERRIEIKELPSGEDIFLTAPIPLTFNTLTVPPCGLCPVINQCTPDGVISPKTCTYYPQWLALADW